MDHHTNEEQANEEQANEQANEQTNENNKYHAQLRLRTPFSCIIFGSSQTGKSYIVHKILRNKDIMIDHPIDGRIVYCYGIMNNALVELSQEMPNMELHFGLSTKLLESVDEHFDVEKNNLIIIDDLMRHIGKSGAILDLFSMFVHHKNISVFLTTQNLYSEGPKRVGISRQAIYHIFTRTLDDMQAISTFSNRYDPGNKKFLLSAYQQAMKFGGQYPSLLVDSHPATRPELRVRSDYFPEETPHVFLPKL
jgi:hypothetical protein